MAAQSARPSLVQPLPNQGRDKYESTISIRSLDLMASISRVLVLPLMLAGFGIPLS